MKGFMCVIEGLDGAGGETQTRHLEEFLRNRGKDVLVVSYPNPDSPVGKVIYDYLEKKYDLSPDVQMALYVTDFAMDRERINAALERGTVVVSNRYFQSTLAYQCGAKGVPMEKAISFAKSMQLPVPDIVIYLDITTQTSSKRKRQENGELDRHEEDESLLGAVRSAYQKLAEDGTFSKESVMINGEKGIAEITAEIQSIIMRKL